MLALIWQLMRHHLIEVLASLCKPDEPRISDSEMVTPGETEEDKKLNAKYSISCCRKLGCSIFLLWEDVAEVRPKMILSFIASVMAWKLSHGSSSPPAAAAAAGA